MKKLLLLIGLVTALMFTLTTLSLAQTINVCYSKKTGVLRFVTGPSECSKSETFTSWNQQGPPGPQGSQGPQGPPGPTPILYGTSDPTASDGNDGDLFIKVDHDGLIVTFFGPKTMGNWGTGIELKGQLPGAGPNLTPSKVIVGKSVCSYLALDDSPLYATETYYVAFWILNNGTAVPTDHAPMTVFLDGQVIHNNEVGPVPINDTASCCMCATIGAGTSAPLSVGTHIIKVTVDSGRNDGTTNSLEKSITVQ